MNDLLNDVMHERADKLGPSALDVAGIVSAGDRRVRRRRTAMIGGGVAALVALGAVAPSLLSLRGPAVAVETNSFAAAFAAQSPTYAVGKTVHIAGEEFTVSEEIRAFVQTDLGIVYADSDGFVRSHDGISESETLGKAVFRHELPGLVSDGTTAAWIEDGAEPSVSVFDQLAQEVTWTDLEPVSDGNEFVAVDVLAADGADVYVRDGRGVVRVADGAATTLPTRAEGDGWVDLSDVQAGMFAYATITDDTSGPFVVGPSLTERSFKVGPYGSTGNFSPDGTWLSVEVSDGVPALFEAATGARHELPATDYAWQLNFGWVDDDTYVAVALDEVDEQGDEPEGGWSFDLLTCSVSAADCEVAETEMNLRDGFNLPIGIDLANAD